MNNIPTVSINRRIKQIRQALRLSQVQFSRVISLSSGYLAGVEVEKRRVNDRLVKLICSAFKVNERWLKEGDGEMFSKGPKIIEMSPELYHSLCDRNNPSEMLVTAKIDLLNLQDVKLSDKPFILLFDRPSDTGNLGSIIRSANSFNVDALFIIGHGVDIYDPKVIRSSLGGIFFTQIVMLQSLNEIEEFISREKAKNGMKVLGTDSKGDVSLAGGTLSRPLMIIIGNEARGISLALKGLCDGIISIPISGQVNSLNVASAAGIFMWEVYKNS
jgi:TrmH family RNA methyltransferase